MSLEQLAGLFTAITIFGVLVIYAIHVYFRNKAYAKIARVLDAQYQAQGLMSNARICGQSNGRQFIIESVEAGNGKSATIWTEISVNCQNKGILLMIFGDFFNNFPNWKHALTKEDKKAGAFEAFLRIFSFPDPLEYKHRYLVQSLFQEATLLDYSFVKNARLEIKRDKIVFSKHGVVKDIRMIRQVIQVLTNLARHIEATPII